MVTAIDIHEVTNQSPPLAGVNLFTSDPALEALVEGLPRSVIEQLSGHGSTWGSADSFELGRMANKFSPQLNTHDAIGRRIDSIEFHPAFHALMRRSVTAGLHASIWDAAGDEGAVRTMARTARLYMTAAVDSGHLAGITSTNAAVAALGHAPQIADRWLPGVLSRRYDHTARRPEDKQGLMIGFAAVEKQSGTDRESYRMEARESVDGSWALAGHKWFVSSPESDGFVVLAHTIDGLTAFLVPRMRSDGSRNALRLIRLKATLGQRSGAIAEVELDEAAAWLIGEGGNGAEAITDMMALMRLDATVVASGMVRHALATAVHHSRYRKASGMALIDQPLMTRVLADMALDVAASAALSFRLAEAYDRAGDDPSEAAFSRLMTPVGKYWITKLAPLVISEAMDCLGGNAFVEESRLARLYRDAPATILHEGTGNAMCIETMRLLRRSSEPLELVLGGIEDALGENAKSSLNVLRAATAVALADEGSARILVEQLAMTAAAAALRRRFPSAVSDAFMETRLSKPWRTTYGMLDSRFDSKALLNYLFPSS